MLVATITFTGNAGAFAQASEAGAESLDQAIAGAADRELADAAPVFVSEPVVQELPETEDAAGMSVDANSLRELVSVMPTDIEFSSDLNCLAGAVYFESRGEPLDGQLAVAQVVVNRAESNRFPSSYCGVVYQKSQFSFVRGGRMPSIARSSEAWKRAKAIAQIAHEGLWEGPADEALFFHATYVNPGWRKQRLARVASHVFYR